MRIAITGASGLVGSALQRRLLAEGHQLLLLARGSRQSIPQGITHQSVQNITWNPAEGVEDRRQLEGLDAFVHLAGRSIGQSRWSEKEKLLLRDSRVLATQRLVTQIRGLSRKPPVFISASAIGIYGESGDQWVDESSSPGEGFLADLARDWEQASLPLEEDGVRVVHARLGVVLAAQGGALAKMLPLFQWGLGGVLGSGKQYMSWIDLSDCCRALLHLLSEGSMRGPVNLVSPNPVTNREFTKTLGQVLHRPTILPAPKFALRAALGEMADALLLSSCRVRPERLSQSRFSFEYAELNAALRHLLSN